MIARRSFMGLVAAAIAVSSVAACASRSYAVSGTVSYRERLILPADSQIVVRLEDISRGPAYPQVVTEQRITPNSAGTTTFSLPYGHNDINPNATYVVNAWVEQGGRVLFRNAKVYQVLTKTAPSSNIHVELEQVAAMVVPAPAPATTVTPSSGTVIVQPAPQGSVPGSTYVVQPAPATAPPGSVILNPAR
ncbi:YbaY family lipoprotein [Ferrovibrio sp.]|uniref:YbaY family lipoprotein n=1 Tax=Ferrovibrio sp. TaxID=1917215 RepID=UPI002619B7C6|nr:YbaY family lipoprotein [Ferrovibrio sp.]